ncbi:LysR family transcriptional regulator [Trinickia mobilis]|uniref:LysR family transcriptional regulator n=1 Tax=Trinickia mobilis TaxID=2816356 RepID=UPI001A8DD7F3|nr:LysR family transcriptional regulator [Trinickia mobilis]
MDQMTVLGAFVRVVETGSFSTAAKSLGVGQPTVSKAIATLEARLAVRLLLRSTRGLTPTDSGSAFYERAKRILLEVEQAEYVARRASTELFGRIRVSADVTFARIHIMPLIGQFLDKHPCISLDIVLDDRNVDLIEEGVDVALRIGTLDISNLTARKIGEARQIILGAPSYFQRFGTPTTPTDLASHQFITYSRRRGGRAWTFQRNDTELSLSISGRLSVNATEGIREAVLSGAGIAISPEWMFSSELKSGLVKTVLMDWRLPPSELFAVIPAGRMVSAKTRAFIKFVEESLGFGRLKEASQRQYYDRSIASSFETAIQP